MDKNIDLILLHLLHQCSHKIHKQEKFYGQNRLLIQLLSKGQLTQRELIDLTGRRSATLSEQLENMDKAGYIMRTRNETDRRNVNVTLTDSGVEAAKKAQNTRIAWAQDFFLALTDDDKKQLMNLLNKLLSLESEATSQ